MCGLFTITKTSKHSPPIRENDFRALSLVNRERGLHSFGAFDDARQYKRGHDALDALSHHSFSRWWARNTDRAFIVGHTRHATRGKHTKANAHPFTFGAVTGSHNGVVDAPHHYAVDSMALFDSLNDNRNDYQKALESIGGYWSIAWRYGGQLWLSVWRNTFAFALSDCGRWLYGSSDSTHLRAALSIDVDSIVECVDGDVFSFDGGEWFEYPRFESRAERKALVDWRNGRARGYPDLYYDDGADWSYGIK